MAEKLELQPGQVYSLKVIEVRKRNKQIQKKDQLMYDLYDVFLEGKEGKQVWGEFVTRDPEDVARKTFVVGVIQYIRCGILSKLGTPEIEPAEEPGAGLQQRIKPQTADLDKSDQTAAQNNPDAPEVNSYSIPVSGKSITFAMGYAKDILIQELANSGAKEATEADLQRMIRNANTINNAIVERVSF